MQVHPVISVVTLSYAAFTAAFIENAPTAVLPSLASSLGVSESTAVWSLAVFAGTAAITAIPVVHATRRLVRRDLVVTSAIVLLVSSVFLLSTTDLMAHLVMRGAAGLAAGVMWSVIGGYAYSFAPAGRHAAYLTAALFGGTLSIAIAIPLAATLRSWHATVATSAALAAALVIAVLLFAPHTHLEPAKRPAAEKKSATTWPVIVLLAIVMLLGGAAHNATASALTLTMPANAPVAFTSLGLASLAGGIGAIVLLHRHLLALTITMSTLMVAGYAILSTQSHAASAVILGCTLWGLGWGPLPAAVQAIATGVASTPDTANATQLVGYNVGLTLGPLALILVIPEITPLVSLGTACLATMGIVLVAVLNKQVKNRAR